METKKEEKKSERIDRLYREEVESEDVKDKRAFYDRGWFWFLIILFAIAYWVLRYS